MLYRRNIILLHLFILTSRRRGHQVRKYYIKYYKILILDHLSTKIAVHFIGIQPTEIK